MARVIRYFEAKGATRDKLREMLKKRTVKIKELIAWAETHGGCNIATHDGIGFGFIVVCQKGGAMIEPKLWKLDKHKIGYSPRKTTKAGAAIHKEMHALCLDVPCKADFAGAIGLEVWGDDLYFNVPGVHILGERVIVLVPTDTYTPPEGIELERMSDVEFEQLKVNT